MEKRHETASDDRPARGRGHRRRRVCLGRLLRRRSGGALRSRPDQRGEDLLQRRVQHLHTDKPNKNKIGPSLFGVIGRHAGSAPGFDYSEAMKVAPVTWTDETLDRYLADPKSVVPGNKMPYQGVKNDERRKEIIAYLHTLQ